MRLSPSGNQRQSFGTGGHVVYDPPGTYQTARFDEVAIYPDGSSYALADIVVSALGAVLVHVGPTGDVLSETVFAEGDTLACTQEPRAMHLASQTGGDSIIVAGECTGLNAVEFTDEHLVRRVLAQAVPREIDAGGRSVALGEAARPDPDSGRRTRSAARSPRRRCADRRCAGRRCGDLPCVARRCVARRCAARRCVARRCAVRR